MVILIRLVVIFVWLLTRRRCKRRAKHDEHDRSGAFADVREATAVSECTASVTDVTGQPDWTVRASIFYDGGEVSTGS